MITMRVTVSTEGLIKEMNALVQKQLPFARSLAINNLGLAFQKAERERLTRVFTLRRPDFILREGVKRLSPAATKANPVVTFGVSDRADFLDKFETGTPKVPTRGAGHSLAVPQQVRRTKRDLISAANRPRALVQAGITKKGAGRVFVLRTKEGKIGPGIFQTTGRKGKGALKFLYALEPEVKTPKILEFADTARAVASELWPSIFEEALKRALATAK